MRAFIYSPNDVIKEHLKRVMKIMARKGPANLRATKIKGRWHAIEGSHRLKAAQLLKMPVVIKPVLLTDQFKLGWMSGQKRSVEEILKIIRGWHDSILYRPEVFIVGAQ